jgi:hypothetical protein
MSVQGGVSGFDSTIGKAKIPISRVKIPKNLGELHSYNRNSLAQSLHDHAVGDVVTSYFTPDGTHAALAKQVAAAAALQPLLPLLLSFNPAAA